MHLALQNGLEVQNKDLRVMSEMTQLNRLAISSNPQGNIIDIDEHTLKNDAWFVHAHKLLFGVVY